MEYKAELDSMGSKASSRKWRSGFASLRGPVLCIAASQAQVGRVCTAAALRPALSRGCRAWRRCCFPATTMPW